MTDVNLKDLKTFCANISKNIRETFPNFDVHFLIYAPGEKLDRINELLPHLKNHPAFEEAASILKFRTAAKEGSGFLGIAESLESIPLSFKKRKRSLAFIAVDYTSYANDDEARQEVHALVANMFDFMSETESAPRLVAGALMQPKKSQTAICRTNLKSDIYSVLQLTREGIYDAPLRLAKRRSIEALTPQSRLRPEDTAFPISLDVINYALENHMSSSALIKGTSQMVAQYQLANQISSCFETENLQIWSQFANNSQTMAWNGFTASQILGAAVNTSTNPFIKALGHLLAEITNLSPIDEEHLPSGYNPFIADEINQISHDRQVNETFEMVLIHTVEADSHLPFLRVANNQNDALLKGKISGWCAGALQAAAKAYISAKERGIPPQQAARLEFQSVSLQSNWKSLLLIGQYAVNLWRKGEIVTMGELMRWSKQSPDTKFLFDALSLTISDPNYTIRLNAAAYMPSLAADFTPTAGTAHPAAAPAAQPSIGLANIPSPSLGGTPAVALAGKSNISVEDE